MSIVRQDAWNDEHDQVLAQTVLSHIRNGSTQLAAFEETAIKLKRTAAACGFRWNKEIRKQYEAEIKEAKMSRVKQKSHREVFVTVSNVKEDMPSNNSWDYFLQFLREQRETMDTLVKYVQQLEKENRNLKQQLESLKTPEIVANEDYQALMQIMQRARSLGVLNSLEAHV